MDHEGITYLAPDTDVLQRLMVRVLEDERGKVGLKLLPFVDTPGITYNYRVSFEDGTGEVIREESIPSLSMPSNETPSRHSASELSRAIQSLRNLILTVFGRCWMPKTIFARLQIDM